MSIDKKLQDIINRLEAATKGQWVLKDLENKARPTWIQAPREKPDHPCDIEIFGEDTGWHNEEEMYTQRDADFIFAANAKDDISYLLSLIEKPKNRILVIRPNGELWECENMPKGSSKQVIDDFLNRVVNWEKGFENVIIENAQPKISIEVHHGYAAVPLKLAVFRYVTRYYGWGYPDKK